MSNLLRVNLDLFIQVPPCPTHYKMSSATAVAVVVFSLGSDLRCRTFKDIYGGGKNLCEKMWGDSFVYSTDEDNAYTMWFSGSENPNDVVTERLSRNQTLFGFIKRGESEKCLSFLHKDEPSPEPDIVNTACPSWKQRSCCHSENVRNPSQLESTSALSWNMCGKLSSKCEKYFVNEACMYECEPAVYHFMKFPDHSDATADHPNAYDINVPGHNKWQLSQMPIKSSYCDSWYRDCESDLFCGFGGGNFFACAEVAKDITSEESSNPPTDWTPAVILIIVMAAFVITRYGM